MAPSVPRRLTALVVAVIVASAFVPATQASAAEYPSWDDVTKAQKNESATAAEITRISDALDRLDAEAAERGVEAVAAEQESAQRADERDQAAAQLDAIETRLHDAEQRETVATQTAGAIAARLARNGDGDGATLRIALSQSPESLLSSLSTLEQLTSVSKRALDSAAQERSTTEALRAEAAEAKDLREKRATAASRAAVEARDASTAADKAVDESTKREATLYAQLAKLKSTTARVEKEYRTGQAEARAIAAQQEAARVAAANNPAPSAGSTQAQPSQGSATGGSGGSGSAGSGSGNSSGSNQDKSPAAAQAYASSRMSAYGWSQDQFSCLVKLWNKESGWNYLATNPSSQAYGIPQSLKGDKMATAGADWRTNPRTQINWGLSYISSRYGTPCSAWSHSQAVNWY
ncbi:MAG: hypothetical protein ACTJHU_04500 [Mycetocola sp.]